MMDEGRREEKMTRVSRNFILRSFILRPLGASENKNTTENGQVGGHQVSRVSGFSMLDSACGG